VINNFVAETVTSFIGSEVAVIASDAAGQVASVVKKPVDFVKKVRDGGLQIAGLKPKQLAKELSALTEINTKPNSIVGGLNAAIGKVGGARKTIMKHTGLDVDFGIETLGEQFNEMISMYSPYQSKGQLNNKFKNYVKSLRDRVKAEISDCISKHLRALRNKIPALDIALDPELFIAKEIGKIRSKLQQKIDGARSKLLFKKIRIQQIGQFQMDILKGIRGFCPSTSPTAIKRIQTDDLYKKLKINETADEVVSNVKGTYDQIHTSAATLKTAVTDPKSTISNIVLDNPE